MRLFFAVVVLVMGVQSAFAAENPLLVGVRLAETQFKGWSYGHRMDRKQINCVQFMGAVVEDLLGRKLEPYEEEILFIKHLGRRRNLKQIVLRNDTRTKGIQTALVRMRKGEIVQPLGAEPGDFVQFWRRQNGRWFGHTGILVNVMNRDGRLCSLVFGAHQSLNGVGVGEYELGLNDPNLKVYLVRFSQ